MSLAILLCFILFPGFEAEALSYDYTASIECLAYPHKPQYNGGIIQNPELNDGLQGWTPYGGSRIEHRETSGNKYVVAHGRNKVHDSVSQKINLKKDNHYTLSAWIQVSEGNVPVTAVVKTNDGYKFAGIILAESNCWSMLKGGFTADTSGAAELYFESNSTSVEIWIDSVSLQPFTEEEWRSHQYQSIEKARKRKALVQVVDEQGKPLPNASIAFTQLRSGFPFGSAMNNYILNNRLYQNWFTSRFTVTTFANEMKWYSNEYSPSRESYAVADNMLQFAKQHNIAVRGHNIFWDDPHYQPSWVPSLSPYQLNSAVERRLRSVVSRYRGQVIAWDVVNENLHFSFFESKLGLNFSARMFNEAHYIDGQATLFLNEYNTVEDSRDGASTPARYVQKIRQIQSYPGNRGLPIGIGLEAHFPGFSVNLPYMRSSIDYLAATGFPIWMTEIDVANQPRQTQNFELVLREAHSHPSVRGIVMWTAWSPQGCYKICLVDNNFRNLPAGNVVDKLLHEWGLRKKLSGTTDQNGFLEVPLFHGHYEVQITHPLKNNYTFTHHVQVTPTHQSNESRQLIHISLK
ncbi:endo-1,4-beta-xylanase 5-like [Abrus precatorius]|uniref:Endo-1,4-beta-xylanase 5-like n=1 Tax=Abrus precatorius TaxID=3816 RepID=A0A8B8LGW6_ABRPR|nr:endo-1,4-beta-xylanase 5-like [Abrus precatorius]